MHIFKLKEEEKNNHYRCPYCHHSDDKSIKQKEATQERIRIMRRVIRKLCNDDKQMIAKLMEEANAMR